jgi:hypothetical protein
MNTHVLENAKAYAALASLIVASLLNEYGPDGKLGVGLTIAAIVLGAFATWRVPNQDAAATDERGAADVGLMLLVGCFVGIVLLLFGVRF